MRYELLAIDDGKPHVSRKRKSATDSVRRGLATAVKT
jgi:hypothetical protein